jgi:hypothetical protein
LPAELISDDALDGRPRGAMFSAGLVQDTGLGQLQTEKYFLELVLNCRLSETIGASHAGSGSCAARYCRQASATEKRAIRANFGHLEKIYLAAP